MRSISRITRLAGASLGVATAFTFLAGGGASAQCRDPWVTQAVREVAGHQPNGTGDTGECDYRRYGGGHWTSYDDLVGKVRVAFGQAPSPASPYGNNLSLAPKASDFTVSSTALGYSRGHGPARGATVNYQGRQYQVVNVIAQGGGNLIAENSTLVSTNGGNLQVTLRLIGQDGASIVINQGSNIQSQPYRRH